MAHWTREKSKPINLRNNEKLESGGLLGKYGVKPEQHGVEFILVLSMQPVIFEMLLKQLTYFECTSKI